jgi:threonine dehydratase
MTLDAASVEASVDRLRPVVRRTALERSDRLSDQVGTDVLLKREDVQRCRSYKVRGAYNLMSSLAADEQARGVICASAGNHGQGVAFSCQALEIHGRILVPSNTPRQKRERILALGGDWVDLVISGSSYDETSAIALEESQTTGAVYVHPFDDWRTIVGQGTVAVEIADQHPGPIGTMLIPIGGGGLAAGMALWSKEHRPDIRLVGVEPAGAASMEAALKHGGPVVLPAIDTFVDGAAVAQVGELTYPIVRDLVDEVISVAEGAVCTEMIDLYQSDGIIAEPAGALASAAVRQLDDLDPAAPVVCIVSGGNNDVSRYSEIVERSLIHQGLRHYFLVTFPQEPGALRRFLDELLVHGEDIVLFEYVKKSNRDVGPALVGIELNRPGDLEGLLDRIGDSPLQIEQVPPGSPMFTFLL